VFSRTRLQSCFAVRTLDSYMESRRARHGAPSCRTAGVRGGPAGERPSVRRQNVPLARVLFCGGLFIVGRGRGGCMLIGRRACGAPFCWSVPTARTLQAAACAVRCQTSNPRLARGRRPQGGGADLLRPSTLLRVGPPPTERPPPRSGANREGRVPTSARARPRAPTRAD